MFTADKITQIFGITAEDTPFFFCDTLLFIESKDGAQYRRTHFLCTFAKNYFSPSYMRFFSRLFIAGALLTALFFACDGGDPLSEDNPTLLLLKGGMVAHGETGSVDEQRFY